MQIYDGLHLITARPDAQETARVAHHLFGIADPAERWSVGRWANAALGAMSDIRGRDRAPVLVGGTGLYFAALTRGLAPIPEIGEEARSRAAEILDQGGVEALRETAVRIDPDATARVDASDRQRLQRIVEVGFETGEPISRLREATEPRLPAKAWRGVVIEPDRETLYTRIDQRFDRMLAAGALEEVEAFAERGLDPSLPAMKALGVLPLIAHLRGEMSLDEAVETAKRDSRRYAKRQLTWFRNQTASWPRIRSLDPETAIAELRASLGS